MMAARRFFRALLFGWRKRLAERKARRKAARYGMKFLVLVFRGRPVVLSMQGIRALIAGHCFAKGFTAAKAEDMALYVARPAGAGKAKKAKKAEPCS